MMQYKIVQVTGGDSGGASELQNRVNEHIADGWAPVGGVCAESWESGANFYQAMTRTESTEASPLGDESLREGEKK
jgi:nicotinamide riboside kinase